MKRRHIIVAQLIISYTYWYYFLSARKNHIYMVTILEWLFYTLLLHYYYIILLLLLHYVYTYIVNKCCQAIIQNRNVQCSKSFILVNDGINMPHHRIHCNENEYMNIHCQKKAESLLPQAAAGISCHRTEYYIHRYWKPVVPLLLLFFLCYFIDDIRNYIHIILHHMPLLLFINGHECHIIIT